MSITTIQSDSVRELILWALAELTMTPKAQAGIYQTRVPLEYRDYFGDREQLTFTFDPDRATSETTDGPELFALECPLFDCLVRALAAVGPAVHTRPKHQPEGVHDVASRLLGAYRIQGGHLHLAGCSLTDRPFLRLTYPSDGSASDAEGPLQQVYIDPTIEIVPEEMAGELRMHSLVPFGSRAPRLPKDELVRWIRSARQLAQTECPWLTDTAEPLVAAVVWCKYVDVKLQFTLGETTEELSFSEWGAQLAPRPFVCRHTGVQTFELAGTDDGRIVAADQIEACQATGRRVLRSELVQCSVTGSRVLPEFTLICPVTNQPVLKSELVTCNVCQQQVSSPGWSEGCCSACRSMTPVTKADPRMARLLGEHPGLDRWRKWKLSETGAVYIAVASGPLRQLLVVVEKHSLDPLRIAQGNRLLIGGWKTLTGSALEEQLR